jgi:hypothetical protein
MTDDRDDLAPGQPACLEPGGDKPRADTAALKLRQYRHRSESQRGNRRTVRVNGEGREQNVTHDP